MIYSTIARSFTLVLALLLAIPTLASAQDWAQEVLFPGTKIAMNGIVNDSLLGTSASSSQLITTSATNFTDGEGGSGSFVYTKLSPTTAKLSYTFNYWEDDEGITESGVISLNYTSPVSGTYAVSSSYIVYLNDGTLSGNYTESGSFSHTIASAPSPPVIGNIGNASTPEKVATTVAFTISDPVTPAAALTINVVSSNTVLVPQSNISLGGSGSNRTVTLLPVANQWGLSTITITVSNGFTSSSANFVLTVIADNRAPTISVLPRMTVEAGSTTEIPFTIADINSPLDSLIVSFRSAVPSLVSAESILVSGSGTNRTLIITAPSNQTGLAIITVTVSDGSLETSQILLFTIANKTIASWRQTHFGSHENEGDGADLNDFDGDGMVNLLEYALGSSPTDPSSVAHPVISTVNQGSEFYIVLGLSLTINKPAEITDILYKAQVSDNLLNWSDASYHVRMVENSDTRLKFVTERFGEPKKRFIRLVVSSR